MRVGSVIVQDVRFMTYGLWSVLHDDSTSVQFHAKGGFLFNTQTWKLDFNMRWHTPRRKSSEGRGKRKERLRNLALLKKNKEVQSVRCDNCLMKLIRLNDLTDNEMYPMRFSDVFIKHSSNLDEDITAKNSLHFQFCKDSNYYWHPFNEYTETH